MSFISLWCARRDFNSLEEVSLRSVVETWGSVGCKGQPDIFCVSTLQVAHCSEAWPVFIGTFKWVFFVWNRCWYRRERIFAIGKDGNAISHSQAATELNSEVQVLTFFVSVDTLSHVLPPNSYRMVQLCEFPLPYRTTSFLGYAHVVSEICLPDILEFTRPTVASRYSTGGWLVGILFCIFCAVLLRSFCIFSDIPGAGNVSSAARSLQLRPDSSFEDFWQTSKSSHLNIWKGIHRNACSFIVGYSHRWEDRWFGVDKKEWWWSIDDKHDAVQRQY